MKDEKETLIKEIKKIDQSQDEFVTAKRLLKQEAIYVNKRNRRVNILKSMLGDNVLIECPMCGHKQRMNSTISATCYACHHRYKVYPRDQPSRVYYCPPKLISTLKMLSNLQNGGRMESIL